MAFVVSDLNVSIHDGKNTVWLLEDVLPPGKYAISIAQVIIMLLENYTEIMYELPKLDQVAVPNLLILVMESLGIVTQKYVMIPMFFLTYWNYNTLFQVKVSLVLLQRDLGLMLIHIKRPNLTNCDAFMIHWH